MSFTSKQFRHISTGEIVTQVPISRFNEYEEVDEQNYRIFCEVSGGITGYNSAYFKVNGVECLFSKDAAQIRAKKLTAQANRRMSRATFKYTPEAVL